MNGDGKADLVVSSSAANAPITVFLGNGDGTLQAPLNTATGTTYINSHSFAGSQWEMVRRM